ncbi:hypothetical protein scyTo_0012983, partial [Scyliorhinus torazame]|nr:hypothetical protein [Scyliorhinus torazame]
LSEEAGNSAKGYFSLPYFRFREPKSEQYTTSCKANAPAPSAVISPVIGGEASKEHSSASSICLQHAQAGHSHQPLSNQNVSLINRLHTAALTTTPVEKSILDSTIHCRKASADGDNGTVKLISFIGNVKQKVAFTMSDKKQVDVSLRTNDFIQGQISTAQKDCTTECQHNGHAHSEKKDTPSLTEGSAHLFIFLSNMNKGTNYDTTEPKYKCQHHKVQSAFSEIIRESADIAFHNNYVELNGKLKDTVREDRKKPAFSMIAKSTTGSPTVTQGEDTEINQSELNTVCGKTALQLLTLQEALEMYKPDFISRSQKRLQQLEVKAKQRKVQLVEPMKQPRKRMGAPVQNTPFPSPIKKRQCTVPDPLSDNLFKPRERMIPEKEMQMRSKR